MSQTSSERQLLHADLAGSSAQSCTQQKREATRDSCCVLNWRDALCRNSLDTRGKATRAQLESEAPPACVPTQGRRLLPMRHRALHGRGKQKELKGRQKSCPPVAVAACLTSSTVSAPNQHQVQVMLLVKKPERHRGCTRESCHPHT